MEWALQVVVQSIEIRKLATASERTFVSISVPRTACSHCLDVLVARQSDHRLCNNVISVDLLHMSVDLVAIETRRAIAGFEMNSQAGRGGVGALAKGAGDVVSLVDARMHVLMDRMLAIKTC